MLPTAECKYGECEFRVSGSGLRDPDFGFRVSGFGFRESGALSDYTPSSVRQGRHAVRAGWPLLLASTYFWHAEAPFWIAYYGMQDEVDAEAPDCTTHRRGCRVGMGNTGSGCRVSVFRFRVLGFGFRVSGFGFRVSGSRTLNPEP